jgi:hypothetical protein
MQYRKLHVAGIHLAFRPILRHISGARQKALVLGVYSYKNAPVLAQIVEEAKQSQWEVSLWALDRIHPLLAPYSIGAGKSAKFPLLNRLIRGKNLSQFDWIVVTDDDVFFEYGSVAAFLSVAEKAGMDLAQPAHALSSFSNHQVTVCHPWAVARLTTFVEIGPLFAIRRDSYHKFLPFPESSGMGWGLDVEWSHLQTNGARLGIVDWVTLRHLRPLGSAGTYDTALEEDRLREALQVRGIEHLAHLHRTVATWHVWEGSAPWAHAAR